MNDKLNEPLAQELIERFIAAYNSFDIKGMLRLVAADIRFENYSGDRLTAAATGIKEFRALAEHAKALFSEREQRITSVELRGSSAVVAIHYRGRLAADLPNGPTAGTVLELEGTSEYFLRDGRIAKLIDRSSA
jgi:hypothetical protein